MRNGNALFETTPAGFKFHRYRTNAKEERWAPGVKVGKLSFEQGKVYKADEVMGLSEFGIRIVIDPAQPERKLVVSKSTWTKANITPVAPKAETAE